MLFGKNWNSTRDCQDPVINCLASLVKFTLIGAALVDFVWQLPHKILRRCCDHGEKLPLKVLTSHCAEFVWITCEKKIKKKIK
jgi:hypothetical protein